MKKEKKYYLTEISLGNILEDHFKGFPVVHHPRLKLDDKLYIPDYLVNNKIIFEFNGPRHYTSSRTCVRDLKRNEVFQKHGFIIKEIPYFFQMREEYLYYLYQGVELPQDNEPAPWGNYPHGFWDKKVVFPADFCSLGILRMLENFRDIFKFIEAYKYDILFPVIASLYFACFEKREEEVIPTNWCNIFSTYLKNLENFSTKEKMDKTFKETIKKILELNL